MTQAPAPTAPQGVPGEPPAQPGSNIDGLRSPGTKTIGKDHRFKVKKGIDLQGTSILNAALIPARPDELASKQYVDQVATGTAGVLGLTQAAGDARYLQLTGGALTGPLEVPDATNPAEPVSLGQLQSLFYRFPDPGGLSSVSNPVEGSTAFIDTTAQFYTYQNGVWVGVSTFDNPQDNSPPASKSVPMVPGNTIGETIEIGTTTFSWNGSAWDRLTPVDFDEVRRLKAEVGDIRSNEFIAPRGNAVRPNNRGVNDLNLFLDPGSFRILNAVHSPGGSGTLIVSALGSGPGVGSNVAVEQIFFSWKEGTTSALIQAGDVFVRVGFGGVWSDWERINEQWVNEQIADRIGFGKRFVGTYDAAGLTLIAVPNSVGPPYVFGSAIPDPIIAEDGDYLIVKVPSGGAVVDPNLPVNDDDGNPLELLLGDYLVNIQGAWHRVPAGGGGGPINLPIDAVDVTYDNSASSLASTTVQAAIDELSFTPGAWRDILDNNLAVLANAVKKVVSVVDPAIVEIDISATAATGAWAGKIVGAFHSGVFDYQVAWEIKQGVTPPVITLSENVSGTTLDFSISPDIDLTKIRGKYMVI